MEGNPLRARMVERAQEWPWSSLGAAPGSDQVKVQLSPWPVDKPGDWADRVNEFVEPQTLERVRLSIARNRPYGDDQWIARVAKRHGLESTLRDPWRPKKTREKGR